MTDTTIVTPKPSENSNNSIASYDTLHKLDKWGANFTMLCGPVCPGCKSPGKVPHEEDWPQHHHTIDEAVWRLKTNRNVGILCDAALCAIDIDLLGDEFIKRAWAPGAPYIGRDDPTTVKVLCRLTEVPQLAGITRHKLHPRSAHNCIEFLYGGNAVVAGTHHSGETIRLFNPEGELPCMTYAQALDLCDTWVEVLRSELLPRAEPELLPVPETTPEPEPSRLINEAAKAEKLPLKTLDDLLHAVLKAWTPLQVFEHFGLAAHGTQPEKDGWVRVFGNGGLFVKGEGAEQFWCLTGAAGGAKVPGGGAVQAWAWCDSGQSKYMLKGKEFVDTVKAMAEAAGYPLPAELVVSKGAKTTDKAKNVNGRVKVDFNDLVDPEDIENNLRPGNWGELELENIEWEWRNWIARGTVTIISAESGMGKSMLLLRLAGCYLCGWPWPDGTPFTGERGSVVWCESEAAQALNRERADNWNLPVDNILTPVAPRTDFTLTNMRHVEALAEAMKWPHVKFVVIDSLSGAYPEIEKGTADTMPVMKWLAGQARDNHKPLIASHHFRKRGILDSDVITLDRLRGASAIVQPARLVLAMDAPDPNAPNSKRLAVIKSNLGKYPDPVGMTIGDAGVDFGIAPEVPKVESQAERAMDLLRLLLEREPLTFAQLADEFRSAGISEVTMRRAKAKLGIVSIKDGNTWKWGMPAPGGYPYDSN